jgi:flagella basal body P-ring formation protein FlgA
MKCWRRSTTCRVSAWLLAASPLLAQATAREDQGAELARRAIETAVHARMGDLVRIGISDLRVQINGDAAPDMAARSEPSARVGRQVQFSLLRCARPEPRCGDRIGSAAATITASGLHARSARAMTHASTIEPGDVFDVDGDPGSVPIAPLARAIDLVGATLVRDIDAGVPVPAQAVRRAPLVKSGGTVTVRAVVDGIVATTRGVASQSGGLGAVIVFINQDSGRRLKGKVTGPGEVEVLR